MTSVLEVDGVEGGAHIGDFESARRQLPGAHGSLGLPGKAS